jgi:tetratricopeptide (TPR) repeat protein
VAPERPLLLLVDALDQLSATAARTDWLPPRLAPGVRVVVSVLPDRPELAALRGWLPTEQILPLGPLAPAAGRALLRDLLAEAPPRTLTTQQEEAVLAAFAVQGLPLYLRLVAGAARRWRSFDPPRLGQSFLGEAPLPDLPETVADLLAAILARLEAPERHGWMLVARALGDLAAGRFGLAEDELLDLLARDDEVRTAQQALSPNSPPIDPSLPLPVALWARLFAEIEPLLTEREAGAGAGILLLTFYHQQLRAAVEARYLAGPGRVERHRALADYFVEQPWQFGPGQWNWRKVDEVVTQQERAEDRAGAEQLLSDFAAELEHTSGIPADDPQGISALVEALQDRLSTGSYWSIGERFYLLQLAARRAVGNRAGEGETLSNLGTMASFQGRHAEATGYYEQALAIRREIGDRAGEGVTLDNLAAVEQALGQRDAAARQYQEESGIFVVLERQQDLQEELMTVARLTSVRPRRRWWPFGR